MKKALLHAFIFVYSLTIVKATDTNPFVNKRFAPEPVKAIKDTLKRKISPWQVEMEHTITNSYFWRGLVFNKGCMYQPTLTVTKGKWTLSGWSNVVLKEAGNNIYTPEADMFLIYKTAFKKFSFAPTVNVYFYPSNYTNIYTAEISGVFKYNAQPVGFYFSPSYDFINNLGGYYMDYGLFREDSVNSRLSINSKLLLGFGNKKFNDYYNYESGRFAPTDNQAELTQNYKSLRIEIGVEYKMSRKLTVKPQLIIYRSFTDGNNYSQPIVSFNGAIGISYKF